MKQQQFYKKKLFKERLNWSLVVLFSAVMMCLFSPKREMKDIACYFFYPISFFDTEKLNPFNQIIEKVIPEDISDRFKHLMDF